MGTLPRSPGPAEEVRGVSGAWAILNVLVTGGASFIGSHLVDALVDARRPRAGRRRPHERPPREHPHRCRAAAASSSSRATCCDPERGPPRRQGHRRSSSTWPPITAGAATSTCTRPRARPTWRSTAWCSGRPRGPASRRSCSPPRAASTRTSCRANPARGPLPDRGPGRPAVRRRQPLRLGQADGRADAAGPTTREHGHEGGVAAATSPSTARAASRTTPSSP